MLACDFLTVETVTLRRICVRVFIELHSRRVAGCTESRAAPGFAQQAHDLPDHAVSARPRCAS
jgi:hypothetical protein